MFIYNFEKKLPYKKIFWLSRNTDQNASSAGESVLVLD